MSVYTIYNIFSGGCIGALIMTYFLWRQERRHRHELDRINQQIIAEVKSIYRQVK